MNKLETAAKKRITGNRATEDLSHIRTGTYVGQCVNCAFAAIADFDYGVCPRCGSTKIEC